MFGSEVNLSSKLGAALATNGEILLTDSAYKQVAEGKRQFDSVNMSVSGLDLLVYKVRKGAI